MSKATAKKGGKDNKANPKEQEAKDAANKVTDIYPDDVKFQLRKEVKVLRQTIEDEERMLNFYQQEREKINYDWIIAKKELEDLKSEVINKDREIEDLRENQMMTINLYKQRVKHLLFENQDNQTALKKDVEVTLKQREDEHRYKERELKFDNRTAKVQVKEQEINHVEYTFALMSDFDRKQTELRQDFERRAKDVKDKYDLKMKKLRTEMEEARAHKIRQIEERKDLSIKELTTDHTTKYHNIKSYYADITATNLDLIKQLKAQITEDEKRDEHDKKVLAQIEGEQKKLQDALKAVNDEIKALAEEQKDYEKLQEEKERIKAEIENAEMRFRKLEFEYEVKLQQLKYLERERDALSEKFNEAIYDIQSKTGLKNLILEKQVAFIEENLEVKDLQLNQILQQAPNLDPNVQGQIMRAIEEVEASKNDMIGELQRELQQIRKAHTHMVKAYEAKLQEFVIPVEELGFDPLVPTSTE